MKYNKKLDPFNEEDWSEEDIPQEEVVKFIYNLDDLIPEAPELTNIYIRRHNGEYHFFGIEGGVLINNVIDYIDGFNNPDNEEIIDCNDLIRSSRSERKGLWRGKIKIYDGYVDFNVKELRNHLISNQYRFKIKI